MRPRWLPFALVVGCTSSAAPSLEADVPAPASKSAMTDTRDAAHGSSTRDDCGSLRVIATQDWRTVDPLLDALVRNWDPYGVDGTPVAIRRAEAPAQLAEHTFVQVRVANGPREVIGCFVGATPDSVEPCADTQFALYRLHEHAELPRPTTARGWAALIGVLDGATEVYTDGEQLARCAEYVPRGVLQSTPKLQLREGERLELGFVERFDPTPTTTMFVAARLTFGGGLYEIDYEELWTAEHGAPR